MDCSSCGRTHRLWAKLAECQLAGLAVHRSDVRVFGEGPWASVSMCSSRRPEAYRRIVSVHLYAEQADTVRAKAFIDGTGCGGGCSRHHQVIEIKVG